MKDDKLKSITNLFEESEIRSVWDSEKETKKSAISSDNKLNYKYTDDKMIEEKNKNKKRP
jgi:hypothetical protein